MELIYSTSDLKHAIAWRLRAAGLSNHVSGSHSSQLAGFAAARTPASVGVWLARASDLPLAQEIMRAHGYLPDPATKQSRATKHRPLLVLVIVAIVVAGLALLSAGGP